MPLLFPEDEQLAKVRAAFFDPFEYLAMRHKDGLANVDFAESLGKVAYHAACHQRVQAIGQRTREFLSLVPDTKVTMIEALLRTRRHLRGEGRDVRGGHEDRPPGGAVGQGRAAGCVRLRLPHGGDA